MILEDNENVHQRVFRVTFEPNDDLDGGKTYFPDVDDIEHIFENSDLDQANEYYCRIESKKKKSITFIIDVINEDTDEYFPDEDELQSAIEDSNIIDTTNDTYVEEIDRTIERSEYRDSKLNEIGI